MTDRVLLRLQFAPREVCAARGACGDRAQTSAVTLNGHRGRRQSRHDGSVIRLAPERRVAGVAGPTGQAVKRRR
jgi:hypothetical protein